MPASIRTETAAIHASVSQPPSGPKKRSSATTAHIQPAQTIHCGKMPVRSPTNDVPAMSVAMPTKAKRYIHPDSASDTKPSCASL